MKIVVCFSVLCILISCGHNKNDKQASQTDTSRKTIDSNTIIDTTVTQSVPDPTFPNTEPSKIIGTPVKLGKLEVASNDLPDLLTWELAKKACESLGQGWRLPTKNELNEIYKAKTSLGSFTSDLYWSSTEVDEMNAQTQNMYNGKQGRFSKIYMCKIRAVRSL